MGAEVNAGTGKETTSVYSRFLDGHLERAFDVLPGHGAAAGLPGHRLRAPGGDRGDRHVRGRALGQGARRAGRRGLRRPPARAADHRPRRGGLVGAGAARSRRTTTGATCPATSWSPRPGNLDHERIVALVDAARSAARGAGDGWRRRPPDGARRRCASTRRRPSSTTSASARPGIARGDERRFALRVLDTILGGSTSSRLFQEVREKRGLAYSVYSYSSHYADSRPGGALRGHAPRQRAARRWR